MSPDVGNQEREREMMMELQEAAARKQEAMKESMMKWKSEREKNSDYIEQLRRNKEERKKEIEAQEALMIQMKEEQEAADAAAEAEAENMSDEADAKPATAQKKPVEEKKNFADQKKFKSKEQQEFQEQLEKLIKPFDVAALDTDALKKKVEELYDIFTNLINDKININKRIVEQDTILKSLREKLNEILDAKAAKKNQIDMHKFYPGKKSSHPPKMQIFSKYDNRKGTRSYDERKEMYDQGTDIIRPKMLESMWEEKFAAWLSENPEED